MANFYAVYPGGGGTSGTTVTANQGTVPWIVAGQGTAGVSATGVVTIQGIAGGTAIPISGSITATNPSVSATGAAVPADATYIGGLNGGNLIGLAVDSSGRSTVVGAGTAGSSVGGVVSIQGVGSGTAVPVSGTLAVTQSTSPWIVAGGGTAGVAAAGTVTVQGIASMTPIQVAQTTAASLNATVVGAGSAGTANVGVVTVQGIASMTPVQVSQGTAASLNATVVQGTAANLNATVVQTTAANLNAAVVGTGSAGTAATGVVTVQGISGGTALPVTTTSTTTTGTFQDGAIAFGSLTTSFATVVTAGGVLKHVDMRNNTNAVVAVSLNSGSTTSYTLDIGDYASLDLAANNSSIANATTLQAKYVGGAPTSGNIRINCFY
jgi:hypothetical protein